MTRAGLLAVVATAGFFAYVNAVQLAFLLVYIAAMLGILGMLWSWWGIRHLRLTRASLGDASAGQSVVERFTLSNLSGLPVPSVEIHDLSRTPGAGSIRVLTLGARETISWEETAHFPGRGRHPLGPTEVRICDPFGLFPRQLRIPASGEILVYPATVPLADPSPLRANHLESDRAVYRALDLPPSAAGIREHHPADPISRVHWVSSARRGKLMSRSFETEEASALLVILDLCQGTHCGEPPESSLEYAVSAAATLVRAAIASGRPVALTASNRVLTRIAAGRGLAQERALLSFLATATDDGETTLAQLLARELPEWGGRGGVTLVTSDATGDWAEVVADGSLPGERALAVFVDPAGFQGRDPSRIPAQWRLAMDLRVIGRRDDLAARLDPVSRHAVV